MLWWLLHGWLQIVGSLWRGHFLVDDEKVRVITRKFCHYTLENNKLLFLLLYCYIIQWKLAEEHTLKIVTRKPEHRKVRSNPASCWAPILQHPTFPENRPVSFRGSKFTAIGTRRPVKTGDTSLEGLGWFQSTTERVKLQYTIVVLVYHLQFSLSLDCIHTPRELRRSLPI